MVDDHSLFNDYTLDNSIEVVIDKNLFEFVLNRFYQMRSEDENKHEFGGYLYGTWFNGGYIVEALEERYRIIDWCSINISADLGFMNDRLKENLFPIGMWHTHNMCGLTKTDIETFKSQTFYHEFFRVDLAIGPKMGSPKDGANYALVCNREDKSINGNVLFNFEFKKPKMITANINEKYKRTPKIYFNALLD